MKINFGKYKNRNIIIGKNKRMRPTQSMAKSIIFNIIHINDRKLVIDLFAGTGLLGFEAMSLGAKSVYWFDNNRESVNAIKNNINKFKLNDNFKVFNSDFRVALKKLEFKPDIIFLDPPFSVLKYYDEALNFIYDKNILNEEGIIVLEKPHKIKINSIQNFFIKELRRMGDKDILILSKK